MLGSLARRFVIVVAIASCTGHPRPAPVPSVDATDDDAAVYAAVLDSLFNRNAYQTQEVIVLIDTAALARREAWVPEFWAWLYGTRGSDTAAVDDLERRGHARIALRSIMPALVSRLPWRLELVSRATLARIPRSGPPGVRGKTSADWFWDGFYQMFPRSLGTVALSPIGYDQARDRAVLFIEHGCHALCGEGNIVTVRRDNGRWHVVTIRMTWVS